MASYIALKPCVFGGVNYYIGDAVPADAIGPEDETRLVSMGYIAKAGQGTENNTDNPQNYAQHVENIEIPMLTDGGIEAEEFPVSCVTDFFVGLQKSAADVVELVESETRPEMLHLLKAFDTRKTVKAAAEKRLADLAGDGE